MKKKAAFSDADPEVMALNYLLGACVTHGICVWIVGLIGWPPITIQVDPESEFLCQFVMVTTQCAILGSSTGWANTSRLPLPQIYFQV